MTATNAPTYRSSDAARRVTAHSHRSNLDTSPPGVVSLAMGEPDFTTHPEIIAAAHSALLAGATHYVDQRGTSALREAVSADLLCRRKHAVSPNEILITHGATGALSAAILGVINPGDKVVIPEPCYSLYPDLVQLAGGQPVFVPAAPDLHWDLDCLTEAAREAAVVIICNPCNPTGILHGRDELEALSEAIQHTEALVLADEAYDAIVFDGRPFVSALEVEGLAGRTVYCQTFSKSHAMTGWRIGYLTGPPAVVSAASLIHRTVNGALNAATQAAAVTALSLDNESARRMLDMYAARRDQLLTGLAEMPGFEAIVPEGTFYAFPRYDIPGVSSVELTAQLRDAGVLVRAGSEYGASGEGRVRLSFAANPEQLTLALERMAAVSSRLHGGTDVQYSRSAGS